MPFKIVPHAKTLERRREWGWTEEQLAKTYADHRDIKLHLGLAENAKLPADMDTHTDVPLQGGGTTLLVVYRAKPNPTGDYRGKSSAHRTYAQCPDCKDFVPAGRAHQHKCKGN